MTNIRNAMGALAWLALAAGCAGTNAPATTAPVADNRSAQADANAAIAAAVPATDIYLVALDGILRGESPTQAKAITNRNGYDNQPAFSPDGQWLWFASIRDGVQSDVFRYRLDDGKTEQVTATAPSEYSPTPLADGGFSAVQVALDGTQRLWLYANNGQPLAPVRPDITGVGYHAWLGAQRVALFLVGEPQSLIIADRTGGDPLQVALSPGRALHHLGDGRLGYVNKARAPWSLLVYDPVTGEHLRRASLFESVEDVVWLQDDSALTANGRSIYRLAPAASVWTELASLSRVVPGDITRMAVDPSGRWLAVVSGRSEAAR